MSSQSGGFRAKSWSHLFSAVANHAECVMSMSRPCIMSIPLSADATASMEYTVINSGWVSACRGRQRLTRLLSSVMARTMKMTLKKSEMLVT